MPIFFMAVIALGLFIGMGLMLFYAAYVETKTEHENAHKKADAKPAA
jgi:hypothetical protein